MCNERWVAPRIEIPNSMPVNHVCALELHHEGSCVCSCKAVRQVSGTGSVVLRYPVALTKEDEGKWIVMETPPARSIEVPHE